MIPRPIENNRPPASVRMTFIGVASSGVNRGCADLFGFIEVDIYGRAYADELVFG